MEKSAVNPLFRDGLGRIFDYPITGESLLIQILPQVRTKVIGKPRFAACL